jgi:hypothetical protein
VSVEGPLFVRVMVDATEVVPCSVEGNVMLVELKFIVGAAVPVPVNVTWCGEPTALSVTTNDALSAAADAGLNPT